MAERCPTCNGSIRRFYDAETGEVVVVDAVRSIHGYVRVVSLARSLVRVEQERTPGLHQEHFCGRSDGGMDLAGS